MENILQSIKYAKILLLVSLASFILVFILACTDSIQTEELQADDDTIPTLTENIVDNNMFGLDTHIYLSERVHTSISRGGIYQGSFLCGNTIYYYYTNMSSYPNNTSSIVRHNLETIEIENIELPFQGNIRLVNIDKTDDGNFILFAVENDGSEQIISGFIGEYDEFGNEISRNDLGEIFSYEAGEIVVEQAVFTDDYLVILISHAQWNGFNSSIYIVNSETLEAEVLHSQDVLRQGMIAYIGDNRVVIPELTTVGTTEQTVLRKIDLSEVAFGDEIGTVHGRVLQIFSASENSPFDLMLVDENFLQGLVLETGQRATVLNWAESGINNVWANDFGLFNDERIYSFSISWTEQGERVANLNILTPVYREDRSDLITITLGGINIGEYMYNAVELFNLSQSDFQIVIDEYIPTGFSPMGGQFDAEFSRLQIELMTGSGPDIIYGVWNEIGEQGLLLDLHEFIEADSQISKDDFVPNLLYSLENTNGSLYAITNEFAIDTMFGVGEFLDGINSSSWTTEVFANLISNNRDVQFPFGLHMSSEMFMFFVISVNVEQYVNFETFEANFDNESFIDLLNIARYLNDANNVQLTAPLEEEPARLRRGEQFMKRELMVYLNNYMITVSIMPDITAIGYPSDSGGVHILRPWGTFLGINAATDYPNLAWEFLRTFLLPSENFSTNFPLREDMLEEAFDFIKTPFFGDEGEEGDENTEQVEIPSGHIVMNNGDVINIYAMTEEQAESLRHIIDTAKSPPNGELSGGLWRGVIVDDLAPFFAGSRSAEETARIIQNRAQIFLDERVG